MRKKRKSPTLLGQRIPVVLRNVAIKHQLKQSKLNRKISLQDAYREVAAKFDRRN
tara:strand:+ start:2594 stop:2758 length:165 start_codon:yes stop_codon:yes gene_type:complete